MIYIFYKEAEQFKNFLRMEKDLRGERITVYDTAYVDGEKGVRVFCFINDIAFHSLCFTSPCVDENSNLCVDIDNFFDDMSFIIVYKADVILADIRGKDTIAGFLYSVFHEDECSECNNRTLLNNLKGALDNTS